MKIKPLPNSVTVQYSELMQNCIHPISDGSNISFKSKVINGKRYWYLYISLGKSRREHYLGQETTELLDQIDAEKSMWESDDDDRELRKTLVKMLVAGGMTAPTRNEGKLLALLERSGVGAAFVAAAGPIVTGWDMRPYDSVQTTAFWLSPARTLLLQTGRMNLQSRYDLEVAKDRGMRLIEREVTTYESLLT